MKYVNLGRTGLKVSRIALGCMSYGTPTWRPWDLDEAAAQPIFQKSVESGITLFDTADMYSLGVSEEITGRALRKYARMEEVVLATKVFFPMNDRPNMGGLSRKHILQACEASLKRLGVETIDLYQIHRMDPETPLEETLAALDQLVRQGKVRYVGASSSAAWRFGKALGLQERHGWARFVSMQNHYNLVYREEEREMIPLCQEEGIGLLPWSPLARGMLARTSKGRDDKQATTRAGTDTIAEGLYDHPSDWDVVEAVQRVAAARGSTPAEVSLAWLLSRPMVAAPIIGATKLHHLEAAVKAVDLALQPAELEALQAPYQPHGVKM